MKQRKKIPTGVLLLVLAWWAAGCGGPATPPIERESLAFSAPCARLSGDSVTLANYAGRHVLLDISATWTPESADNAALLNRLHDTYAERGLTVVGLLLDDETHDATSFIEQHAIRYPVGLANQLIQERPFSETRALPTKWLLERGHRRVGNPLGGMLREADLIEHIETLLEL